MGLDMYLYAKRHVSGWDHDLEDERATFAAIMEAVDAPAPAEESPHAYVEVCVAYWRKANAIHSWFVENVQDGKDECLPHYVSREQLADLRTACLRVLGHEDDANEALPTAGGFFFGGTEYGDWYVQSLESTVHQIDGALNLDKDWSFYYRSSW